LENVMMEDRYSPEHPKEHRKAPEARYAYYRRCQVFRRNGEQCKGPAEKGTHICYAHTGQRAMAVRRELERRAVLAEAVAQMRRRGRPEFEAKDLFMDFKGIQVTLAVMAQALIDGRIDCKTAGRLVVQLQTVSKLLRMVHRAKTKTLPRINTDNADLKKRAKAEETNLTTEARRRGEEPGLPQICADERRLSAERALTTKDTRTTSLSQAQGRSGQAAEHDGAVEMRTVEASESSENADRSRIAEVLAIRRAERTDLHSERAHGPPEWARAA
jgi:hypothetical protein